MQASLERSFAALSHALLIQKEELQLGLQALVNWAADSSTTLNKKSLFDKVKTLFAPDSPYQKVSEDILQMVCGRRTEAVQFRRKSVLGEVKEEHVREGLNKIPPSTEHLFNKDSLTSFLSRVGATDKLTVKTLGPQPSTSSRPHVPAQRKADKQFFRGQRRPPAETNRSPRDPPNFSSTKGKKGGKLTRSGNPKGDKWRHTRR